MYSYTLIFWQLDAILVDFKRFQLEIINNFSIKRRFPLYSVGSQLDTNLLQFESIHEILKSLEDFKMENKKRNDQIKSLDAWRAHLVEAALYAPLRASQTNQIKAVIDEMDTKNTALSLLNMAERDLNEPVIAIKLVKTDPGVYDYLFETKQGNKTVIEKRDGLTRANELASLIDEQLQKPA